MKTIHTGRLYRKEYATFEECCEEEFEMTRQHVHRLIQSFDMFEEMSQLCDIEMPKTKSHFQILRKAPPGMYKESMILLDEAVMGLQTG